jgi:phosphoribosylformylglycinamidine (FGAM) synthase-like enzyme
MLDSCREKIPLKAWEMWFPVRLSKAMLQARATLAAPAVGGKETSFYKEKQAQWLTPIIPTMWEVGIRRIMI